MVSARPDLQTPTRPGLVAVGVVVLLAAGLVLVSPEPVLLGAQRLAAYATIVAGASLLVSRVGAADLALAAAVAVGAYAGGVAPALAGLPLVLGVATGTLAGLVVGGLAGAVHGRLGRTLGALASLAVAVAVVALLAAWGPGGGVAGFHAVALPTPWGTRADLLVVLVVLGVALAVAAVVARRRPAALAAMAVRAPEVVIALGRRPSLATAALGAASGALCGLGGVSLAAVSGSVLPDAYGLPLAAAIALAGLVGGVAPWGPLLGAGLVWGPSTVWPLAPVVGTAPPLLVAGPLGLAVLALTGGRPLTALLAARRGEARSTAASGDGATGPSPSDPRPRPSDPHRPAAPPTPSGGDGDLRVRDLPVLDRTVSLEVAAGEVVALTGPNGAGKSTLLAMVAGRLPDHGRVEIGGRPAPPGARARARGGLARTWQQAPDLPAHDVRDVIAVDDAAAQAAHWARGLLGDEATGPGVGQLVLLASRRPALALLDEPTDVEADRVLDVVRGLAEGGAAVLLVDHRPEVVAGADRIVELAP